MTKWFTFFTLVCTTLVTLFSPSAFAARHAVILQYQHISDRTPPSKSATETEFVQHLDYLKNNGFTVWPLEKIVSRIRAKQSLPDKVVAITFDHGYISVYRKALKHLSARQLPFTVFVAAAPVIKEHPLYMNWQQLREVQKAGGTIGSMGITGSNFAKSLPEERPEQRRERLTKELQLNQKALQKYLGVQPTLFAYTDGQADDIARKAVTLQGLTGFGLQQGPVSRYNALSYLPRFTATGTAANITNLPVKLTSLPLPVRQVKARTSLLSPDDNRPEAELELLSGSYQLSGLRCQNAQGLPVDAFINEDGSRPKILLKSKLGETVGPVEYTCTAPHDKSSRFYWFSQTWIRPDAEGNW